eukprot:2217947-Pleurochrysis_carterae.AAC.8
MGRGRCPAEGTLWQSRRRRERDQELEYSDKDDDQGRPVWAFITSQKSPKTFRADREVQDVVIYSTRRWVGVRIHDHECWKPK